MQANFLAEFYTQNRNMLRSACGDAGLLVITANGLMQRTSDSAFNFQQDSNFWYLTGIEQPDMTLVMDGADEFLIVPELSKYQSIFDGVTDRQALSMVSGIPQIMSYSDGWDRLQAAIERDGKVGTPFAMPTYVEVYGMYVNPSRRALVNKLGEQHAEAELIDIRPQLVQLRCRKQPVEIAALQKAIDITIAGITNVVEHVSDYAYEYEIEADLSRSFRRDGGDGHAFTPIVAGGPRACVLHNVGNNAPLKNDELIVLDVGAEVSHYSADISRTIIPGRPSTRQQAVYDSVIAVQDYALGLLKPGILLKDYEKLVETRMGQELVKLNLITNEAAKESANIRHYYPHATSHFLGLDVHDVGDYRAPLEAGMVITCEPGIYIANEGIGIRVEDDVLITTDGKTVLTAKLPRTL